MKNGKLEVMCKMIVFPVMVHEASDRGVGAKPSNYFLFIV